MRRTDLAPLASGPGVPAPFTPTAPMLRYLAVLLEHIAAKLNCSNVAVCRAAHLSRATLWSWKHRPGFNDWLAAGIHARAAGVAEWETALAVAYREAAHGSTEHLRILLEVRKLEHALTRDLDRPLEGPQLIFTLPRPPADLEGRVVVHGAVELLVAQP